MAWFFVTMNYGISSSESDNSIAILLSSEAKVKTG